MSYYYPQAAMSLRILWEDFDQASNEKLQKLYKLDIIARRVTVNINDYTQADTFDCEIDYKSFPFDPRCIRSCGVSIFIQDMGTIFRRDNRLNLIKPGPDNVLFQGFVDEETITFDEEKRIVKMEGRDFTSLLIDQKRIEGTPIPMTLSLDKLIEQLLGELKSTEQIVLDNRTGQELPVIAKFAPDFGANAGHKNPKKDETYWEIIQDLVGRAGLIAYIEIDKLVVSTPRTLYNKKDAKNLVYGRHLKNLEYKRKLGRHKGFNVIVRSLDIEGKEVIEAKIPEEADATWAKDRNITNTRVKVPVIKPDGSLDTPKDAPFISFRVPDIKSKDKLIEIGQKIYEEMSRQQIEGNLSTKEMSVGQRNGVCFDMTKLRVGMPIKIEIDAGDLEGIKRVSSVAAKERFLIARCYEPKIARALAETLTKFDTPFYTKAVQFTVDADNGFSMKIDFINYIELSNRLLGK